MCLANLALLRDEALSVPDGLQEVHPADLGKELNPPGVQAGKKSQLHDNLSLQPYFRS